MAIIKGTLFAIFLLFCAFVPCQAHDGVSLSDLLSNSTKFSVLIELLTFTDLLTTVSTAKNVTIFAPTDYGFMLSADDIACSKTSTTMDVIDCFKDMGKQKLSDVLKYHVVPLVLSSTDVLSRTSNFPTLLGLNFTRRGLRLNDVDDRLSNPKLISNMLDMIYGHNYVHAINRVLLPFKTSFGPTLIEVLRQTGDYQVFLRLIENTGLEEEILNMKNITAFIPNDRAFITSGKELFCTTPLTVAGVLNCTEENLDTDGQAVLVKYHILSGSYSSEKVLSQNLYLMENGVYIYRRNTMFVDQNPYGVNARLSSSRLNIVFENGIMHGVTRSFLPFRNEPTRPCDALEFPVSLADTSFLPLFKIVLGAQKCQHVRDAINDCDLLIRNICSGQRGDKFIGYGLDIGTVVAAAGKCDDVVTALRSCNAANWDPEVGP